MNLSGIDLSGMDLYSMDFIWYGMDVFHMDFIWYGMDFFYMDSPYIDQSDMVSVSLLWVSYEMIWICAIWI